MVVYGFLSYENGTVSIPNKELMDHFSDMLKREASLGYVYQLAKESEKMLRATLAGDTATMEQILELVHDTETPLATDGIILELKVGHSPEDAIAQIKEKNYAVRFAGNTVGTAAKTKRVLLVGIGYDKRKKKHQCKVEVLE